MKRFVIWVQFCAIILSLVSVTSCFTATTVTKFQDPSVSWQEQALILPRATKVGNITVFGVDNKKGVIFTNYVGIVPSGTHTIYAHVDTSGPSSPFFDIHFQTKEPIPITYNFQPGEHYVIGGEILKSPLRGTAEIYTVDEYRTVYARLYPNEDPEELERGFKTFVLDYFDRTETELGKK